VTRSVPWKAYSAVSSGASVLGSGSVVVAWQWAWAAVVVWDRIPASLTRRLRRDLRVISGVKVRSATRPETDGMPATSARLRSADPRYDDAGRVAWTACWGGRRDPAGTRHGGMWEGLGRESCRRPRVNPPNHRFLLRRKRCHRLRCR